MVPRPCRESSFPTEPRFFQVYNPLMLPESLYRFAVQNDPEYVPQLALMVVSADGLRWEGLVGTIVWDGKIIPKSVDEAFARICDGIHEYYMHKTMGIAWELDAELMRRDQRGHPHFLGTGEWVAPSNPWYRRVGGPIQSPICHF